MSDLLECDAEKRGSQVIPWFVKIQMTLLILIVDDWKLTSLLEQVSATRVAFWILLTGESWLAKPPVITMVLMNDDGNDDDDLVPNNDNVIAGKED